MKATEALFCMSLAAVAGAMAPAQTKAISPSSISNTITLTRPAGTDVQISATGTPWMALAQVVHSGAASVDAVYSFASTTAKPIKAATPTGLTATGIWVANCPICKMPMAHVVLSWNASAGTGVTYLVYRDGDVLTQGLTTTTYTDMSVTSGVTYTYHVAAVNVAGTSPASPAVTVKPPFPPPAPPAPANVTVTGIWLDGSTDTLTWTAVPGATSYNLYRYGTPIATGLTSTAYAVPVADYMTSETYTVTAVNSGAQESLPSAPASAQGGNDPASPPNWEPPYPDAPYNVIATPQWNNGAPRIKVTWDGDLTATTYNLYRDGKIIARNLFDLAYYDTNVKPGVTYTYTATGCDVNWLTVQETAQTAPATATAPTAAPVPYSGKVIITGVVADDDSAVVSFNPVPGALDYRCYTTADPGSVKYSGGGLSIEMNGLAPSTTNTLEVQALDKLGPFQTMDGGLGPGATNMGMTSTGVNGQGDPSDIPIVLATSNPVTVTLSPRTLTGAQAFFDNFRNEVPLAQDQTLNQALVDNNYGGGNGPDNPFIQSFSNDKWTIYDYFGDMLDTKIFFMSNHFMDTVYDGGTPGTSTPMHNNNASIVLAPKATANISGGQVLHVTFEVDAHFDPRRWVDVVVAAAGDPFIHPGKVEGTGLWPTLSGNEFRWEIQNQFHDAEEFLGGNETYLFDLTYDSTSERFGPAQRIRWDNVPLFNGTAQDLDKRHRFDLYLSRTRYRLVESGTVIKDALLPSPLPFSQAQVYWVHEIYHTANDRPENIAYRPDAEQYWYNLRPWADERHWDNMGFEVLPSFPN